MYKVGSQTQSFVSTVKNNEFVDRVLIDLSSCSIMSFISPEECGLSTPAREHGSIQGKPSEFYYLNLIKLFLLLTVPAVIGPTLL